MIFPVAHPAVVFYFTRDKQGFERFMQEMRDFWKGIYLARAKKVFEDRTEDIDEAREALMNGVKAGFHFGWELGRESQKIYCEFSNLPGL